MSEVLLKAGYIPTIIFNTSSLLKAMLDKHKIENEKLLLQQLCTPPPGETPLSGLTAVLASVFLGEQLNQANNLGILLISEIGFPFIKKGLALQANFPISLMLVILEESMSGFCAEAANEVRLKGIQGNLSPWSKLLFDAGIF